MTYEYEDETKWVRRLEAENVALREIAQELVTYGSHDYVGIDEDCVFCGYGPIHMPGCAVVKARALLANEEK